jgi:hypothetical protein
MRQMPAGQWVAFEDDAAHNCAVPPKAKAVRKPGPRQVSPLPAPVDDEFGEFVLPNNKPVADEKPAIVGIGTATARQPPVRCPVPGLEPRSRLPVDGLIAVGRPAPTPSGSALPQAAPIHPVPAASGQGFRQWLLRVLAIMLLLGLVKVVLREATRPNLPKTDYTSSAQSDARPNLAGQTSTAPSIKILQTRPISDAQTAPAPSTPKPSGPPAGAYPPWLNKVTLPPSTGP